MQALAPAHYHRGRSCLLPELLQRSHRAKLGMRGGGKGGRTGERFRMDAMRCCHQDFILEARCNLPRGALSGCLCSLGFFSWEKGLLTHQKGPGTHLLGASMPVWRKVPFKKGQFSLRTRPFHTTNQAWRNFVPCLVALVIALGLTVSINIEKEFDQVGPRGPESD